MLRLALPGSLMTVLAASLLVGATLVGQGLYWLTFAGQGGLIRTLMVNVLTREVAPMLVAMVLLARIGTLNLVELSAIRAGPAWRGLAGQGMDPWALLAAPRAFAAGIAGFVHTIFAVAAAAFAGQIVALLLGASTLRPIQFLTDILDAMSLRDFALVALKGPALGFTVALATAGAAIASQRLSANLSRVLARGFSIAALAALLVSLLLSGLL
jgi:phospholipid/cholesterol/gamma-HCH transport system permease protein